MQQKNYNELTISNEIDYSIVELKKGDKFEITGNKIITVVSGTIKSRVNGVLNTFESSLFHSGTFIAEEDSVLSITDIKNFDIVLNKVNIDKRFGEFCRNNWDQLRKLWDVEGFEKVDLYRSKQVFVEFKGQKYGLNFWFCGKEVDCLFHNEHNFIEIHTGIAGDGYMQKAEDFKGEKLIETFHLAIGQSHKPFNIDGEFDKNGNPIYPIHRYLGGPKGNIWLVVEKYV